MSSPPDFTANADAPLSVEELTDDLAKSSQAGVPGNDPEADDWHRPGDEHLGDDSDGEQPRFSEAIVTRLPPG